MFNFIRDLKLTQDINNNTIFVEDNLLLLRERDSKEYAEGIVKIYESQISQRGFLKRTLFRPIFEDTLYQAARIYLRESNK